MKEIASWVWLVVVALIFTLGFAVGWHIGAGRVQTDLTRQTVGTATCVDANDTQKAALESVRALAKSEREEKVRQHKAALTVIASRDAEIATLRAAATKARNHIVETSREDDDCKPLAQLPVCDAVADRLWPSAEEASGSQPSADH